MRAIKKLWNIISTLFVIVIVLLAVALVGVRLVGLTPYTVLSGSMEPVYHVGSLIYVKQIPTEDITVGTPITFVVNEDLLLATHRVVDITVVETKEEPVLDENGEPMLDDDGQALMQTVPLEEPSYYFQTKGDANEEVDGSLVYHKNVVGTPVFSIPYLGYLSSFLQTPRGLIIGVSVAAVIVILTFMPDLLNMVDDDAPKKKKKRRKKRRRRPASAAKRDDQTKV